ncbi:hypothetical protein FJU30_15630 [Affinibrenneria salicis]|uniref:Type 1 fimbrial protein n=1 Tax=Affinibrenneria salicis TaxID=2590031 RepID=A0A5J5FXV3_9GAMM|nr:hypothetical protein [Affinibrenneria salicis]KAA8998434.1 hypothetical protein FJU30_15630 [Affinibrenneria salicis]
MKKLTIDKKILLSLLLPLGLMMTAHNSKAADGIIRFRGAIVESPCTTGDSASPAVSCMRSGKTIEKAISLNNKTSALPYNLGTVKTVNIGKQEKILIISYD